MAFVVTASTPNDGQRDLAVDTSFYVTFNANVDGTALSKLKFSLVYLKTRTPVKTVIDYYVDGNGDTDYQKVKIAPVSKLYKNSSYRLYVHSGTKGVMSEDGEYLADDFVLDIYTGGAVEATPSASDAPEDVYVGSELRIGYSIPAKDSLQVNGTSIQLYCNQGVPEAATTVTVEAKHPLGLPLSEADSWAAAASATFTGKLVTVKTAEDDAWNDNRIYTVKLYHPDNRTVQQVDILSALDPFYTSAELIRLEYGAAAQELSDYELTMHIFRESITAQKLWGKGLSTVPDIVPYYLEQYVLFKVVLDLIKEVRRNSRTTGAKKLSVGDLRSELREVSEEAVLELAGLVNALRVKVENADTGTVPIDIGIPGYALIGSQSKYAQLGTTDLDEISMSRRTPSDPRNQLYPSRTYYNSEVSD